MKRAVDCFFFVYGSQEITLEGKDGALERDGVRDPLDQAYGLVQWEDRIRADVYKRTNKNNITKHNVT